MGLPTKKKHREIPGSQNLSQRFSDAERWNKWGELRAIDEEGINAAIDGGEPHPLQSITDCKQVQVIGGGSLAWPTIQRLKLSRSDQNVPEQSVSSSRWLSAATPPDHRKSRPRTPEGGQYPQFRSWADIGTIARHSGRVGTVSGWTGWHPFRMRKQWGRSVRWYRSCLDRPPAIRCHPFRMAGNDFRHLYDDCLLVTAKSRSKSN